MSDESFITLFMIGVLIILFGLACLVVPNFYLPQNILNLITNNWFIIILGIGVTFVLITGNYDMSVGGNIALTGVLSVYFCQGVNVSQNSLANGLGLPYGVAVALALLCAMGVGADQCLFHCQTEGTFHHRHTGYDDAGARRGPGHHAGCAAQYQPARCLWRAGQLGIPGTPFRLSLLVMIALIIVAFIFERKTIFARRIYLIGANPEAARLSGINVAKYLTALYIFSGLLAGITGILLASEYKAGVSGRATGYEFDALVVTLLGGVSIAGGFGSVLGMFVGAIILSVVTSAATGLLLSPDWQFTLKGIVTFLAILAQRYALDKRKG